MKRRHDPNQTLINWSNPSAAAVAPASTFPDPVKLAAEARPPLIERLPWDFTTTFPPPTEEAIDEGILHDTDVLPDNLKALHVHFTEQLLANRRQLDKVLDARRRGLDPNTGKPPKSHAGRERLRRLCPDSLERDFNTLMLTYENSFGPEAAHAFNRFIIARQVGIPVEIDKAVRPLQTASNQPAEIAPPPRAKRRSHPGSSSLPLPRPLPEAVKAGHFGIEDGKPINPTPNEVHEITVQHAEKIIDLLDGRRQMERSYTAPQCTDRARVGAEVAKLKDQVQTAIDKYAISFGQRAAEHLRRYCQRQHRQR